MIVDSTFKESTILLPSLQRQMVGSSMATQRLFPLHPSPAIFLACFRPPRRLLHTSSSPNRSCSSFIPLPFQRQLDPRVTIPSSTKSLVRTTSSNGRRRFSTSYQKETRDTWKLHLKHSFDIEAKSFTFRQKATAHGLALQISEHRPSLTHTILLPLSAFGWLIKILSDTIELQLISAP